MTGIGREPDVSGFALTATSRPIRSSAGLPSAGYMTN